MLISIHIPKTAGTSFKIILEEYYKDRIYFDYKDFPLIHDFKDTLLNAQNFNKKLNLKKQIKLLYLDNIDCIHGHYIASKYIKMKKYPNVNFVTWLRDPYYRLESHYNYWFRTFDIDKTTALLQRKVVLENWSFEAFCFSKEMQNVYHKFLNGLTIDDFNFIGITEFFYEDCLYFMNNFLKGSIIEIPKANVNPNKKKNNIDNIFLDKIKEFHKEDYLIYEKALAKRKLRLQ